MDGLDSLIDSLLEQRSVSEVSYIDENYAETLKLKQTSSRGQGVFAEQFLSINDPICSLNPPKMTAIDSDFLKTTCYHCLVVTATQLPLPNYYGQASIELKTCNGCHSARFCNKDCQVRAWHNYHKYECKIFKKLQRNLPPAIHRAVMRIVLLKDRDMLSSEEWNRITSLTSHGQIYAARGPSNLTEMAESIKHLAESSMSIGMIQRLIFIMKSNAIELPTPIHGGVGVMLDPLVAKLNHSCEPNVSIHRPQYTMTSGWVDSPQLSEDAGKTFVQLIPLRHIQQGEELLISYVVPTASVSARKAKLTEDYFFECTCPKCLADTKAVEDLANEQPGLSAEFDQWAKEVIRHISQIRCNPSAFRKAAAAMDKSGRYLEYPVLYTTGDFPEIAMRLVLEGLNGQALDEALVNMFRIYLLVNPHCFVGRHNPTNIYTIFLMLEILDTLIGISTPSGITTTTNINQAEKWTRNSTTRSFSKGGLIHWRQRICADLRKRLEGSPAKDLLVLVQKREEQAQHLAVQDQDAKREELKKRAEEEMRAALKLKEPRWMIVLQVDGR